MSECLLLKTPTGLAAMDEEASETLAKFRLGDAIRCRVSRQRNPAFHRKYFALLKFAYEHWEPGTLEEPRYKGVRPEKNFERFRKDVAILSGHYDASYRLDGSVRIEAKSISFGAMSADDFERLYSKTIDVVLKHILPDYTREDLDRVVDELLRFA